MHGPTQTPNAKQQGGKAYTWTHSDTEHIDTHTISRHLRAEQRGLWVVRILQRMHSHSLHPLFNIYHPFIIKFSSVLPFFFMLLNCNAEASFFLITVFLLLLLSSIAPYHIWLILYIIPLSFFQHLSTFLIITCYFSAHILQGMPILLQLPSYIMTFIISPFSFFPFCLFFYCSFFFFFITLDDIFALWRELSSKAAQRFSWKKLVNKRALEDLNLHFPRHKASRVKAISVQLQDRPQINQVGTCLLGDQVVTTQKNNNRIHSKVHPNMLSN